jgi:hypothetical protein
LQQDKIVVDKTARIPGLQSKENCNALVVAIDLAGISVAEKRELQQKSKDFKLREKEKRELQRYIGYICTIKRIAARNTYRFMRFHGKENCNLSSWLGS